MYRLLSFSWLISSVLALLTSFSPSQQSAFSKLTAEARTALSLSLATPADEWLVNADIR